MSSAKIAVAQVAQVIPLRPVTVWAPSALSERLIESTASLQAHTILYIEHNTQCRRAMANDCLVCVGTGLSQGIDPNKTCRTCKGTGRRWAL
jgi:hypothetical protein